MITTRNGAEALEHTCERIDALNPPPVEALIIADGCADDTLIVIRRHAPHATIIINNSAEVCCLSGCYDAAGEGRSCACPWMTTATPEQMDCIALVGRFFEETIEIPLRLAVGLT